MTVGVLLALDLRRRLRVQELTGARLQAELAQAELDALRVPAPSPLPLQHPERDLHARPQGRERHRGADDRRAERPAPAGAGHGGAAGGAAPPGAGLPGALPVAPADPLPRPAPDPDAHRPRDARGAGPQPGAPAPGGERGPARHRAVHRRRLGGGRRGARGRAAAAPRPRHRGGAHARAPSLPAEWACGTCAPACSTSTRAEHRFRVSNRVEGGVESFLAIPFRGPEVARA